MVFIMLTVSIVQAKEGEFGIGPVYQNDQYKGWLIYELKPGDTMEDEFFVANVSDKPMTLRLYVQDAMNTVKTGKGLQIPDEGGTPENMKFLSKWVSLEKNIITLSPYSREIVKVKTKIPETAEKREYAAVIFAHHDPEIGSLPNNTVAALIGARNGLREYVKVTDTPMMPKRYIESNAASIDIMKYMVFGVIGLMIIGSAVIIIREKK